MGPPVFDDIAKPAGDVLSDDYLSKYLLKVKCAPKAMPGCAFTIEDEVKGSAVEGKLTLKYLEPATGISFDKLTVKGSTYGVEASKTVSGVKFKGKVNPHDLSSFSGSAELKSKDSAVTAAVDKKKLSGSATAAPFPSASLGVCASYPLNGDALSWSLGAAGTLSGIFGSCVYTSKKVFNFGLMFKPLPKLTLAATANSTGADSATVGVKHGGLAPNLTVGLKTTTDALHLVCVKKFGKDASLQIGASSKYADLAAKPGFGAQITIG